jgi:hypothetical protein
MSVKFLRQYRIYFAGAVATFRADEEAGLIARGTAVPITLPPAADGTEPEPLPGQPPIPARA